MGRNPSFDRPGPGEHHEYYSLYVDRVTDGDVLETLERQVEETAELLGNVPPEREAHRYAPGKWSIREVIGHVLDSERVFAYRALHFARRDGAPLPSMEQDPWAAASNAGERALDELVAELRAARRSHVLMFRGMDHDAPLRRGVASGREFTVRSFPWIIAGHELHHVDVIRQRYT